FGFVFFPYLLILYTFYFVMIFFHASIVEKSLAVGVISILTSFIQHIGYGLGFLKETLSSSNS
ncbi:MAG: glycosyl transferase family 2, partial [Bacteroidota bacterium]